MDSEPSAESLGWLAAMIDGEGSVGVKVKAASETWYVHIYNKEIALIEECCHIFEALGVRYSLTKSKRGLYNVGVHNNAGMKILNERIQLRHPGKAERLARAAAYELAKPGWSRRRGEGPRQRLAALAAR